MSGCSSAAGVVRYNFGFRKQPYRLEARALRAGYATGADRFRAEFLGDFRRVNSRVRTSLFLRASGIEVVRFFGFGNETPPDRRRRVLSRAAGAVPRPRRR